MSEKITTDLDLFRFMPWRDDRYSPIFGFACKFHFRTDSIQKRQKSIILSRHFHFHSLLVGDSSKSFDEKFRFLLINVNLLVLFRWLKKRPLMGGMFLLGLNV